MRVAVVGGGLGGLAAARALVAAGHDAHVLEAGPRTGGVIGTSRAGGFLREHAASSFLGGPADGALALCAALNVPVECAADAAKKRWIYLDGALRALPRNPVELARSDLLTWRGKLDLVRQPFRATRSDGDDESMHAFAARRFGPEVARAIVAPFVTGVFAADAHDISLEAGFPRLAALERDGGIVRGAARQLARSLVGTVTRRMQRKEAGTARGLWAPVGGLGTLVDALSDGLGDRVRVGTAVEKLEPDGAGVRIDGEAWDAAVLAIPAEDAIGLVAAFPELATRLAGFQRAPSAIVYLGFPADAVPRAGDGFGVLVARGEAPRVLGIVFESVVWPDRAPAGQVLLRCIFGGSRDPSAVDLEPPALIDQATRDVGTVLGAFGTPTHASVVRWRRGVAQYQVGHRDRVRAAVAAARTHRIVLAGADYRGPGVNDLVADAAVIVEEVRACSPVARASATARASG